MNTNRFIVRILTKTIIYTIFSIVTFILLNSQPIITNNIALGQMENSNELYLLMEIYNRVKPFVSIIYGCITTGFVGTTIYDTYKFIQKENKGEN